MQWNIALDIGASGVRMAIRGHGTVYRQSSAMAVYEARTSRRAWATRPRS